MHDEWITAREPLLDGNGVLQSPGRSFCESRIYKRSRITANPLRIKEWDFYQISDERYTVQMVVFDISVGGAATFALLDRQTHERFEAMTLDLLTLGSYGLPESDGKDHTIHIAKNNFDMTIECRGQRRLLKFKGRCGRAPAQAEIELFVPSDLEFLEMAVPFDSKKHFYLNKKLNCMAAKGYVKCGDRLVALDERTAFGVLDWGRGVWPYKCSWYWGNGSAYLPDGRLFGFEIGWGFGNMDAFSENTIFIDKKAHRLGRIELTKDKDDYMKPWYFSGEGVELTMYPQYDNYTSSRVLGIIGNKCHQVFGKFFGYVVTEDGEKIDIENMTAFCEYSDNRW